VGLLDGVQVLSIEHAVAAPLCTRHLAELGAAVVKIEQPGGGDFARSYDRAVRGVSAHFVWLNGGKRSVAVDLKTPVGAEVLHRLLERSDVFVCNLSPAARERLVPDDALATRFPGLVRCYVAGYGLDGPYEHRKAYDALIQGEAGLIASTGTPDVVAKAGISVADLGTGMYAFALVSAALAARGATGRGARIDVSLFDVLADWMSPLLLCERNGATSPPPAGSRHAMIVPYGVFATGDGTLLNIAVQNDGQWRRLCEVALGRPDLIADARYASNERRVEHRGELEPVLEEAFAGLDEVTLTRRLDEADVPWGRVNSIADVATHPQLEARQRWAQVPLENGDRAEVLTAPYLLDGAPLVPGPAPGLGEHTADVLAELGFTSEEIDGVLAGRAS
jgi:itaconate CoA-transferase